MPPAPLGIGVIGAGNISITYMTNAALFRGVRLVACADLSPEAAAARAAEHGVRALAVDALLADPEVDLVLNLTVPAAHVAVTAAALSAGKHVFTEKPLATTAADGRRLVAEAKARGLLLGSAPDTFLGPVVRVQAVATKGEEARRITAPGPFAGTVFPVATPTTILSLLEFAGGAMVSFGTSWDVFRHTPPPIELHGTAGSLRLPDPDTFGGTVSLSPAGADWHDHPSDGELYGAPNWPCAAPDRANYRMLGVADLVGALREGRAPRASGDLALHVLEVMEAIMAAAESRSAVPVAGTAVRPPLLAEDEARGLLA